MAVVLTSVCPCPTSTLKSQLMKRALESKSTHPGLNTSTMNSNSLYEVEIRDLYVKMKDTEVRGQGTPRRESASGWKDHYRSHKASSE